MRLVVVMAVMCLAACAREQLAQAPLGGVDLSGRWQLNVADSDDPQHLTQQAQFNTPAQTSSPAGGSGGRNGRHGEGRGGADGVELGRPVTPSVSELYDGLRWPGRQLEIKQAAGVVVFSSDGIDRVCQPSDAGKFRGRRAIAADRDVERDTLPTCGWAEKTLIVYAGGRDDPPPFEEHYSLSDDGRRLVEVVAFIGGRSGGFTMSRVWDRST